MLNRIIIMGRILHRWVALFVPCKLSVNSLIFLLTFHSRSPFSGLTVILKRNQCRKPTLVLFPLTIQFLNAIMIGDCVCQCDCIVSYWFAVIFTPSRHSSEHTGRLTANQPHSTRLSNPWVARGVAFSQKYHDHLRFIAPGRCSGLESAYCSLSCAAWSSRMDSAAVRAFPDRRLNVACMLLLNCQISSKGFFAPHNTAGENPLF